MRSTSTTRPNGPERVAPRRQRRLHTRIAAAARWLAAPALLVLGSAWAAGASEAGDVGLLARLAVAAKEPELPNDPVQVVLVGRPEPVKAGSLLQLVSLQLRYAGLSNRYCRLAVVDGGQARLVTLPPEALHDDCRRLKIVLSGDLNNDGLADVIHGVVVPSQAGGAPVLEAVVYLSQIGVAGLRVPSYCYASALSRLLVPADLVSLEAAMRAVRRARQRNGPSDPDCS